MKNVVEESKKTSSPVYIKDFPALESEEMRPRYLEVANNTANKEFPSSRENYDANLQARRTIRENFEN